MLRKFLYTGPSWAWSSYPLEDPGRTNLAKEWRIPYHDLSKPGQNILKCVDQVKKHHQHSDSKLPVIWILGEPMLNHNEVLGITMAELVNRSDWQALREEILQQCFRAMNDLGVPILLVGGHSDVGDCDYSNIQIAHPSWQRWLGEQLGIEKIPNPCWGHEIPHLELVQRSTLRSNALTKLIPDFFNSYRAKPSHEIVNSMHRMGKYWGELEAGGLFSECHVNAEGNQRFAEFLKPTVKNFLNNIN